MVSCRDVRDASSSHALSSPLIFCSTFIKVHNFLPVAIDTTLQCVMGPIAAPGLSLSQQSHVQCRSVEIVELSSAKLQFNSTPWSSSEDCILGLCYIACSGEEYSSDETYRRISSTEIWPEHVR